MRGLLVPCTTSLPICATALLDLLPAPRRGTGHCVQPWVCSTSAHEQRHGTRPSRRGAGPTTIAPRRDPGSPRDPGIQLRGLLRARQAPTPRRGTLRPAALDPDASTSPPVGRGPGPTRSSQLVEELVVTEARCVEEQRPAAALDQTANVPVGDSLHPEESVEGDPGGLRRTTEPPPRGGGPRRRRDPAASCPMARLHCSSRSGHERCSQRVRRDSTPRAGQGRDTVPPLHSRPARLDG